MSNSILSIGYRSAKADARIISMTLQVGLSSEREERKTPIMVARPRQAIDSDCCAPGNHAPYPLHAIPMVTVFMFVLVRRHVISSRERWMRPML